MRGVIMHRACLDVAFEIVWERHFYGKYKLKGYWINLGYTGQPFRLSDRTTKLVISYDSYSQWQLLTSEQLETKRTKPGLP